MEIIIFDEVDDGFGMEREAEDMIEEAEESAGFGSFGDFDEGCVTEKVRGTGALGSVEEPGEVGARGIGGGKEIGMTLFSAKAGGALFVLADVGKDAVANEDFDMSGRRRERLLFLKPHGEADRLWRGFLFLRDGSRDRGRGETEPKLLAGSLLSGERLFR